MYVCMYVCIFWYLPINNFRIFTYSNANGRVGSRSPMVSYCRWYVVCMYVWMYVCMYYVCMHVWQWIAVFNSCSRRFGGPVSWRAVGREQGSISAGQLRCMYVCMWIWILSFITDMYVWMHACMYVCSFCLKPVACATTPIYRLDRLPTELLPPPDSPQKVAWPNLLQVSHIVNVYYIHTWIQYYSLLLNKFNFFWSSMFVCMYVYSCSAGGGP